MMRKIHGEGDRGYLPMMRKIHGEGDRGNLPMIGSTERETGGTYR